MAEKFSYYFLIPDNNSAIKYISTQNKWALESLDKFFRSQQDSLYINCCYDLSIKDIFEYYQLNNHVHRLFICQLKTNQLAPIFREFLSLNPELRVLTCNSLRGTNKYLAELIETFSVVPKLEYLELEITQLSPVFKKTFTDYLKSSKLKELHLILPAKLTLDDRYRRQLFLILLNNVSLRKITVRNQEQTMSLMWHEDKGIKIYQLPEINWILLRNIYWRIGWSPENHLKWPGKFQEMIKTILLCCAHSELNKLPLEMLFEIIQYIPIPLVNFNLNLKPSTKYCQPNFIRDW